MLRITSGTHRGRLIQSLPGLQTRPTVERLRQAWLNSLQFHLPDARILDLFSGSGALGFEALSRGASFVTFVEENPKAAAVIRKNADALGFQDQIQILIKSVERCLPLISSEPAYDLIFMDPPYQKGFEEKLLQEWPWELLLADQGRLCIESGHQKDIGKDAKKEPKKEVSGFLPPNSLKIIRDERYGDSQLTFYERSL